jgi:DNA polymerase III alpha subunit (gram-positive type)
MDLSTLKISFDIKSINLFDALAESAMPEFYNASKKDKIKAGYEQSFHLLKEPIF